MSNKFIVQAQFHKHEGNIVEIFDSQVTNLSDVPMSDDMYDECVDWLGDVDWDDVPNGVSKCTWLLEVTWHKDYYGEVDRDIDATLLEAVKFKNFGQLKRWWKWYKYQVEVGEDGVHYLD